MKKDNSPPPESKRSMRGFVKMNRSEDALEVIRTNPLAFILATVIALRGRWKTTGFFRYDLQPGEALLGDYEAYGMSERQYRTAKSDLQKWKFATFKTTNKGTVGKLTDTRLFSIIASEGDGQNAKQTTDKTTPGRRTGDGRATTNEEGKDRRKTVLKKEKEYSVPSASTPLLMEGVENGTEEKATAEGGASCLNQF